MTGRRPAPRPKRGGEEFARTHHLGSDSPTSKKPRFDVRNPSALAPDAPEEDAVLEADEIGKRGQQTKRNAVNIDGYESDSSNEGFDGRAEAKAKEKGNRGAKPKDEEENDMFAHLDEEAGDGDEEEDIAETAKKRKKSVRFLEEEEIVGQVSTSKSGGHVSGDFSTNGTAGSQNGIQDGHKPPHKDAEAESSSESDVSEAERADLMGQVDAEVGAGGKKAHAPKLDAFNMKSEQEEGRFDAQGNFVRKAADPDAVHDAWLEGVSKRDMKRAKEAADKRDVARQRKLVADDAELTSEVLRTLIPYLERGETVLEALARLERGRREKKKKKPKWKGQRNRRKRRPADDGAEDMDVDGNGGPPDEDPAETRRREAVEGITGAADRLLGRGQMDIYDAERELLMRQYGQETGEEWVDAPRVLMRDEEEGATEEGSREWEYRWSDARDGGEPHGPYDGGTMKGWDEAGYFGEGVEFRRVREGAGAEGWSRVVDFT